MGQYELNQAKNKKQRKQILEKLECLKCKRKFGIEIDYMGIITCPYCDEYIEG